MLLRLGEEFFHGRQIGRGSRLRGDGGSGAVQVDQRLGQAVGGTGVTGIELNDILEPLPCDFIASGLQVLQPKFKLLVSGCGDAGGLGCPSCVGAGEIACPGAGDQRREQHHDAPAKPAPSGTGSVLRACLGSRRCGPLSDRSLRAGGFGSIGGRAFRDHGPHYTARGRSNDS